MDHLYHGYVSHNQRVIKLTPHSHGKLVVANPCSSTLDLTKMAGMLKQSYKIAIKYNRTFEI
jgi:hypothetical protein